MTTDDSSTRIKKRDFVVYLAALTAAAVVNPDVRHGVTCLARDLTYIGWRRATQGVRVVAIAGSAVGLSIAASARDHFRNRLRR